MAVLGTGSKWTLSATLDYFIPKPMLVDAEQHRRARMFMLSHVFGPILGNTLPAYLYVMGIVRDERVLVFFLSITAFWIYPFLLRQTGRYKLLAFISVQNLSFCVIWACYAFGGLLSPFLPWMLIIPLLSFLYLPSVGWVRNVLLVQLVVNLSVLLFLEFGPVELPPVDLDQFEVIGLLSMASVAIYFAMMALYFAKMFNEQREFGRELNSLISSSDNLLNLTQAAKQAGAAKSDFIASMSHELRTPLNAIIGYSQLLMEEAEDEDDLESKGDLKHIHASGSHLLYLIDHVLDYSRIEAGRMPVNQSAETLVSALSRWQSDVAIKCPDLTLEAIPGPDNTRAIVTDWNAIGAIVRNIALSPVSGSQTGTLKIGIAADASGGFTMTFVSIDENGAVLDIDLSEEVFGHSQDVSPTKYGSVGIEAALALKYINLLNGKLLPDAGDSQAGLSVSFPPISNAEQPVETQAAA